MKRAGFLLATAWLAMAAGWLAWPAAGAAAVYQWTTPDGVIGLTDDPGRIPDQYRATAKPYESPGTTPLSRQPAAKNGQPHPPPAPSAAGPAEPTTVNVDHNGHDRAWWQARVQELKAQRADLVDQREKAEKRSNEIQYFGRQTYGELNEVQVLRQQMDDLTSQIKGIDQQLASDLPNEARKAGAPMGWLRD